MYKSKINFLIYFTYSPTHINVKQLHNVENIMDQYEKFCYKAYKYAVEQGWFGVTTNISFRRIPNTSFLYTDTGYCFSAIEFRDFIATSNPNLLTKKIKNSHDLQQITHVFFSRMKDQQDETRIFFNANPEILYAIGNAGRLCFFNSYMTSDAGEASRTLLNLMNLCHSHEILWDLAIPFQTSTRLKDLIGSIDNHLHVGKDLITIFVFFFESANKVYDINKTGGLMFIPYKQNKSKLMMVCWDTRRCFKPGTMTYKTIVAPVVSLLKGDSKLVISQDIKGQIYNSNGNIGPHIVTYDANDSWIEIAPWRLIEVGGVGYDIFYVLKVIETSLNMCKMCNPYPQFPKNPYTQKYMSYRDLNDIKYRVTNNSVIVPKVVEQFLNSSYLWFNDNYTLTDWTDTFINEMEKKYRYVRSVDSVDVDVDVDSVDVVGFWGNKTIPFSKHERQVLRLLQWGDHNITWYPKPVVKDIFKTINKPIPKHETLIEWYDIYS